MSKELEALEKIDHTVCLNVNNKTLKFGLDKYDNCDCINFEEFDECYALIEKALKALEIIKMKNVDIPMVKTCNSVNDYNEWHSQYKEMHLTQQEYDLLKEMLL